MLLFIRKPTYIGSLRTRNNYILHSSLLPVHIINFGPLCLVGKFQINISTLILELWYIYLQRSTGKVHKKKIWLLVSPVTSHSLQIFLEKWIGSNTANFNSEKPGPGTQPVFGQWNFSNCRLGANHFLQRHNQVWFISLFTCCVPRIPSNPLTHRFSGY
jgi:hypothetical protein